jgi:Mg2+-importing ATPase
VNRITAVFQRRAASSEAPQETTAAEWSLPPEQLVAALGADANGLTIAEAALRLKRDGPNALAVTKKQGAPRLFANQFKSPLVVILIVASIVSLIANEWIDAAVVLAVVFGSTILGFIQEYVASNAIEKLRSQVTINSVVLRGGQAQTMPSTQVVPGDIVMLSAGSLIPADGVVLEAKDFFVNQAVLTGETFPVEKKPGLVAANASLAERSNCVFMGTSVRSGTARLLVVKTGKATEFGKIADKLSLRPPITEFERGIKRFGYMLTRIMLVMVLVVLAINIFKHKPPIASLLFALALAVGLTPELLPAIISITLSHGAKRMAKLGVIVRRLNSIENLGSMDVLCTDKTGTLTAGVVELDGAFDIMGLVSPTVLRLAAINAKFQTGLSNPLDDAINAKAATSKVDLTADNKVDEIPYDFVRKCLSIVASDAAGARTLITKGALDNILAMCKSVQATSGSVPFDAIVRAQIEKLYDNWSGQGYRVLGVASRSVEVRSGAYVRADECNLCFAGFLLFLDPPKPDVRQVILDLAQRGVQLKIITGDNQKVARHVAEAVDLTIARITTGRELNDMSDEALLQVAGATTVFAEVDPNQKERIIRALQKATWAMASTMRRPCIARTSASRSTPRWMSPRKPPISCSCRRILASCAKALTRDAGPSRTRSSTS